MKNFLLLISMIFFLGSCTQEVAAPSFFTNESYATTDMLHVEIHSEIPGIKITIAPTEEQTYLTERDADCIRFIETSGYDKTFEIVRRYDPEFVRVEIAGETVALFEL